MKNIRRNPPKLTPRSRQNWLWGRHAVEEALRAGGRHIKELRILHQSEGPHIQDMVRVAREAGANVRWVSRSELDKLSGSQAHQGLALLTDGRPTKGMDEFLSTLTEADKKTSILVALDQIQDPHNFGAIARSAVCLGAKALLVPERRTAPVTQAVLQSSAGAIEKIPVYNVGNLAQTLARLKEQGFWIYGADMTGKPAWDVRLNTPLVLVIGSEGSGMRRLIQESCDEVIKIPQDPQGVASLNASCAASVLLYEVSRQLNSGKP